MHTRSWVSLNLDGSSLPDTFPCQNHICSIYNGVTDEQSSLKTFISQSILSNAKILFITSLDHKVSIQNYLKELITTQELNIKNHQLTFFSYSDFLLTQEHLNPEKILEKIRHEYYESQNAGYEQLHIITEMSWALEKHSLISHFVTYEKLLDHLIIYENFKCLSLCQYNASRFPSYVLNHVLDSHPSYLIGSELYPNYFYNGQSSSLREDQESMVLNEKVTHVLKYRNHIATINNLRQESEEFREFSYMLAHDLKSHIRSAHLFNYIIQNEYSESLISEVKAILEKMTISLHEAFTRVDSLNLLLKASRVKNNLDFIDLDDMIIKILDTYKSALQEFGGKSFYQTKKIPYIKGDGSQISQIFCYIIDNCIKFRSPNTALKIRVETQIISKDRIEVRISDNGQGFDNRYKKKIFQPFYRLNPHVHSGCGIGLSICQKIIQQHKGTIVADSEEGRGTTIIVTFPLDHPPKIF